MSWIAGESREGLTRPAWLERRVHFLPGAGWPPHLCLAGGDLGAVGAGRPPRRRWPVGVEHRALGKGYLLCLPSLRAAACQGGGSGLWPSALVSVVVPALAPSSCGMLGHLLIFTMPPFPHL